MDDNKYINATKILLSFLAGKCNTSVVLMHLFLLLKTEFLLSKYAFHVNSFPSFERQMTRTIEPPYS
ncbi:hypothetical protein AUEXF2481DRAFT_198218 [Aureobasidium subglaciale EXF-2481]|uniref:Uncharacterized protein n=1 Tax=Aureobasidium subglaciale (strain EXF-2481) TaxID=1043005 RepID=A0A074YUF7_AURSE|nr:uncharacterized protein AUEXF2481DRAFT_198218 [Aureobasidium subglaciale EXF-2481]KEQ99799.1 hypothetical protein AUEXF2481DRAFT_198218 [Aureobasidium subglaciale EXF-2481]